MGRTKKETPAPADPLSVGHHYAQRDEHYAGYGYDVHPNGEITLAPVKTKPFLELIDREEGLRNMLTTVSAFVSAELARTAEARRRWWADLESEVGIRQGYAMDIYTGRLRPTPPVQPDAASTAADA